MKVTVEGAPVDGVDGTYYIADDKIANLGVDTTVHAYRDEVQRVTRTLIVEGTLDDDAAEAQRLVDDRQRERERVRTIRRSLIDRLGFRPTAQEWAAAGFRDVADGYCADEDTT